MNNAFSNGTAFFFALTVVVPALLAKFLVGASWAQVAVAFPVFLIFLFFVLGWGTFSDEVFGFTLIFHMFFGWLGVPLVALALKTFDLPNRLF